MPEANLKMEVSEKYVVYSVIKIC